MMVLSIGFETPMSKFCMYQCHVERRALQLRVPGPDETDESRDEVKFLGGRKPIRCGERLTGKDVHVQDLDSDHM